MHDADRVRRAQRFEHREPDARRPRGRQRPVAHEGVGQAQAADEFHHDPRPPVRHDHVVHRDDTPVPRARRGERLALHPRVQPLALRRLQARGDPYLLDRDVPSQFLVARLPHRPRTARAEHGAEPVPARERPVRRALRLGTSRTASVHRPASRRAVHCDDL
ncbi:hypothetical protein SSBG_03319 [Streptomyces sp. SPB074]|nr:hypothetical protein SSBG_03319 [Streptomyces sp. SPB074]